MSRRPLVAANWKMNHLRADAAACCRALRQALAERPAAARVAIFPSFPLIPVVAAELAGSELAVGGQDLHPDDQGAHTGDVSGAQLADAGCAWVLCGHSERRQDHGEDDALVARKVAAAVRHRLAPLICVGETRDERRAGRTFGVLERQLRSAVAALSEGAPFAVAYEPVWAIGTGETATPETAQEVHAFLRLLLAELVEGAAAALPILYGGSATPDNAAGLFAQPDVDGFLVGGASLDPRKFLAIIRHSG
ncbi:MAG TPA: triose-phosphate isomerase [Thermoanaerobaculia bacterium]|nr:triose-phosphate isomerase [Thermoanaerobaculia bacterium]